MGMKVFQASMKKNAAPRKYTKREKTGAPQRYQPASARAPQPGVSSSSPPPRAHRAKPRHCPSPLPSPRCRHHF